MERGCINDRRAMRPPRLIPPDEASPGAGRKGAFSWRQTFSGGAIGVGIGIAALLLDASPWWWLAAVVGFLLGASLQLHVSVLWERK